MARGMERREAISVTGSVSTRHPMKGGDGSLQRTRNLSLKRMKGLPKNLRKQLAVPLDTAMSVGDVWAIKEASSKFRHFTNLRPRSERLGSSFAWLREIPTFDKVIDRIFRHLFVCVRRPPKHPIPTASLADHA